MRKDGTASLAACASALACVRPAPVQAVLEELQRTAEIEEERRAAEAAKREQAKVPTVPSLPPISEDGRTDRHTPSLRGAEDFPSPSVKLS